MALHYPELAQRAVSQRERQPDLYGSIDFDSTPHRFTTDPQAKSDLPSWVGDRESVLANERAVELIRTTTMLGDVVADPYAALSQQHGVKGLIGMLQQACREGVDSVPDAPDELRALIAAMENTPDWLDMELVEEGARQLRIGAAFLSPYITRGAFLATFINTYAALPMVLTGALTGRRAARRVNETANFFTVTTLPGALGRYGEGFQAAAMVRLMHSMVRCNALSSPEGWDPAVYGVPVPQADQMPAGLINMYLAAMMATGSGRSEFSARERAMLEVSRYRCFLLGLPEELLPTTASGIVDLFHARAATLRRGFDDATCGELVRSTMSADLRPGRSLLDQAAELVERSWSKALFLGICGGDLKRAEAMSVPFGFVDLACVAATAPFVLGRFFTMAVAAEQPVLRKLADEYTTRVVKQRLAEYGNPEYATDAATYRRVTEAAT
ncbi:DUF2236 domain-containing protein [Saccharopolyspora rhizosphaerae]|uniref:DUF2236 domain-containing protein n=1 Tax=Saccharopolyspora rhizosphaerae TaxID=2492662 RepID=A0A426K5K1_9PSEU|nr:oxygenase MpaB family protein [Saccharopolyspora rhizosphaerae]RRO20687.1 DUF2236 domain-containing protein [Saccharopolyspora rhizosphaerae]